LPAFPGYVFCSLDPARKTPVLATPGVVALVGSGKTPIAITNNEIDALMIMERAKCTIEPWPYLRAGQRVRVDGGALDGLTGIISELRSVTRVIVSVGLLQRAVALEVSRAQVTPIADDCPSNDSRIERLSLSDPKPAARAMRVGASQ
jgi:transcription antitermination factor NusG